MGSTILFITLLFIDHVYLRVFIDCEINKHRALGRSLETSEFFRINALEKAIGDKEEDSNIVPAPLFGETCRPIV